MADTYSMADFLQGRGLSRESARERTVVSCVAKKHLAARR
jgi:hypothetical protein